MRNMTAAQKETAAKDTRVLEDMELQVLVAAVNEEVNNLAEKMHLETEAVIVNQCDHFGYQEYLHAGKRIQCFNTAERGVGRSRNQALMRADKELCLFSDEDIAFYPGYGEVIKKVFEKNQDADIITFNFKVDPSRRTYYNQAERRIRWYNYGRYPTYAVAARTKALHKANVSFSLLFGGGAKYSNGEDSLFLHDCLKKGLHLYAAVDEIGREVYRESTWFKGYNKKFFVDRGVLYYHLYGRLAKVFSLRFLLTHGFIYGFTHGFIYGFTHGFIHEFGHRFIQRGEMLKEMSLREAYKLMKQGIREGKNRH